MSTLIFMGVLGALVLVPLLFECVVLRLASKRWSEVGPCAWKRILLAVLVLAAVGVACSALSQLVPEDDPATAITMQLILIGGACMANVVVISRMLSMTKKRALATFVGATVANGAVLAAVVFGLRPYCVEAFSIPTNGMAP